MAVTITVTQLSQALRLTVSGSPDPPYLAIITRQLAVATAMAESYANDDCPEAVLNESVIRMTGYLLDSEPVNPSRNVSTPEGVLRNSGAKSLLSPWHDLVSEAV